MQPVLGPLSAVAGPDAEDVAGPVHRHRHHDIDRTVRDLPAPDLGSVDDLVIRTDERFMPTVRDHASRALVMCSWSCFRTCPLLIEEVERRPDKVVLRTRVRTAVAVCQCGRSSARVHGRCVRKLRDVAVGGLSVVIELRIRRFRCENTPCPMMTLAEQIAGLTTPHSRQTPLLRGVLTRIGLALAGWAGARRAAAVGITVGKDTLLRLVRALRRSARWKSSVSTISLSAKAVTTARC
ncbi:transposase family protein [Streptomyces sp. NPDC057798]|uniref:transposase family protein n=1 Tax=Streptomyces sp. NPDC057798 TaxID=3346252 RepID=UPI0036758F31